MRGDIWRWNHLEVVLPARELGPQRPQRVLCGRQPFDEGKLLLPHLVMGCAHALQLVGHALGLRM